MPKKPKQETRNQKKLRLNDTNETINQNSQDLSNAEKRYKIALNTALKAQIQNNEKEIIKIVNSRQKQAMELQKEAITQTAKAQMLEEIIYNAKIQAPTTQQLAKIIKTLRSNLYDEDTEREIIREFSDKELKEDNTIEDNLCITILQYLKIEAKEMQGKHQAGENNPINQQLFNNQKLSPEILEKVSDLQANAMYLSLKLKSYNLDEKTSSLIINKFFLDIDARIPQGDDMDKFVEIITKMTKTTREKEDFLDEYKDQKSIQIWLDKNQEKSQTGHNNPINFSFVKNSVDQYLQQSGLNQKINKSINDYFKFGEKNSKSGSALIDLCMNSLFNQEDEDNNTIEESVEKRKIKALELRNEEISLDSKDLIMNQIIYDPKVELPTGNSWKKMIALIKANCNDFGKQKDIIKHYKAIKDKKLCLLDNDQLDFMAQTLKKAMNILKYIDIIKLNEDLCEKRVEPEIGCIILNKFQMEQNIQIPTGEAFDRFINLMTTKIKNQSEREEFISSYNGEDCIETWLQNHQYNESKTGANDQIDG